MLPLTIFMLTSKQTTVIKHIVNLYTCNSKYHDNQVVPI